MRLIYAIFHLLLAGQISAAPDGRQLYVAHCSACHGDQGRAVLVTLDPEFQAEIAGDTIDPVILDRWRSDLRSIFDDVNTAH